MPVTLAEAKKDVQDHLTMGVIDEFRKNNFLLDNLTFDDAVSPTGGGATLTYGYTRLISQPTAQFREVNSEYIPQEVSKQRYNVDLKVFGGAFEIDRIIAGMGGIVSEVDLQMRQKIKAAQALFNDTVINGDSAVDAKAFDGLEKALTGSSTEYKPGVIDLSSSTAVTENYVQFLDELDEFLMGLDGTPSAIMGNTKLIAKLRAAARRASMYTTTKNEFGEQVESYGVIPFVDLGAKAGSNNPVVGVDGNGETSLYAVRLGLDGFHGVSMAGHPPVRTWLPDFSTAGAVKKGEVEMVSAVALKATKAAGVMRGIKVQ
ncbi:major capsid protein [Sporosarcina sp. USHLN248]|uniref:major capsid protein n=1 Tax=Sporosarcina sp. USHLN248 TaxID=3081300 RepID=UPI0030176F55